EDFFAGFYRLGVLARVEQRLSAHPALAPRQFRNRDAFAPQALQSHRSVVGLRGGCILSPDALIGRDRTGGVANLLQALAVAQEHSRRQGMAAVLRQKLSLPLPRASAVIGQEPRLGCP